MQHQREPWSISQTISAAGWIILLILGITAHRPTWQTEVNIGAEGSFIAEGQAGEFYNLFSFYNPERAIWEQAERTFRWSDRRATVTFPFALHKQPLMTTIVACGCRPEAQEVAFVLNNQPIAQLPTSADWRTYRILTPHTLEHPEYGLMVELRSPVWRAADGRELGTALDRVTIQQLRSEPIIEPIIALGILLISGLLLWRGLPHYLPLLLVAVAIVSSWAYRPTLLPLNLWQGTLILGLSSFWFIGAVRNWFIILLTVCLSLWLGFAPQLLGVWVVDDAFISFQYARNFATGNGLVFNPGEIVEGYTNFSWVILSALFFAWQIDPIIATSVLTLGLAYAYAGTAYLIARQIMPAGWSWGVALMVGFSNSLLIYSARGSGMETALFAWLNLLVLAALLQRAWYRAGIGATLTLLTRPDGIIVAMLGGGMDSLQSGAPGCTPETGLAGIGTLYAATRTDLPTLLPVALELLRLSTPQYVLCQSGCAPRADFPRHHLPHPVRPAGAPSPLCARWGWGSALALPPDACGRTTLRATTDQLLRPVQQLRGSGWWRLDAWLSFWHPPRRTMRHSERLGLLATGPYTT